MASAPEKTASTHRSSVARGTHEFQIAGYRARRSFARATDSSISDDTSPLIKSGAFQVGGYSWDLVCTFHDNGYGHLSSIALELLGGDTADAEDVVATASLRIDDPLGRLPAAVWRSDAGNTFSRKANRSCCWTLSLPDAFCGYEDCYVSTDDDRLTVLCTVEVLKEDAAAVAAEPSKCFVSAVPPPTIPGDIRKLLLLLKKYPERSDVTFVVENGTEILTHRLVLAMRSPVFAAELLGHMRESTTRRVQIDDMSASTFRAMLRFIYSDEFPLKPSTNAVHVAGLGTQLPPLEKDECTDRRRSRESMVRDLLVAADRYDLERLRLMCENILLESIDITTVMPTLQLVRGRQSCLQLEDSCIEYIASDPNVYAAVRATKEYKELKKTCSSLIIEVNERVATHNMANPPASSSTSSCRPPEKSMSTFNSSEVVRGTHEFRIPNFSSVQRSHGIGQVITSNIFKLGGHGWTVDVYPSGYSVEGFENLGEYISVYLHLRTTHPGTATIKVSRRFRVNNEPASGKLPSNMLWSERIIYSKAYPTWGDQKFISAKSRRYMGYDGSLTIHCDMEITKEAYTTSTTAMHMARPTIVLPPSNMASHLEQLMVTGQGSDLTFLVEECKINAHRLVVAVRAPLLLEGVESSMALVRIDDVKAMVLKAVIHFIYTDELPLVDDAVMAGEMLEAACRFGMKRMKAMCQNLIAQLVTKDNAAGTKLPHRHWCQLTPMKSAKPSLISTNS